MAVHRSTNPDIPGGSAGPAAVQVPTSRLDLPCCLAGIALKTCTTTRSPRSGCPAGTQDGCSCSETRPLQCRCSPVRVPPSGWPPPPYWQRTRQASGDQQCPHGFRNTPPPDGRRTPAGRGLGSEVVRSGYPACLVHPPDRRPPDEVPGYDAPDKHRRGNLHREPRPWRGHLRSCGVNGWVDRYAGFCVPAPLPARE